MYITGVLQTVSTMVFVHLYKMCIDLSFYLYILMLPTFVTSNNLLLESHNDISLAKTAFDQVMFTV